MIPRPLIARSVATLAMAAFVAACDEGQSSKTAQTVEPPSVTVVGVSAREITRTSRFIGKVEAVDEAALIARVDGFLEELLVEDGAFVEKGEPLVRIEREQYEAELARAKADLAQAEANLALAEIELQRDSTLLSKGTVAQAKYDATLASRDATAALAEAAKAGVRQAERNLGYTEIHAPFDGRIGKTNFSSGDVVGPSKGPIAQLVRLSPIYVGFSLSEGEFLNVVERYDVDFRKGIDPEKSPTVRLLLPNGTEFGETGKVVFVDNRIDPATGTIALRARFQNADGLLAPGTYVTVEIESREAESRLLIPQAAIQRDQKGAFALVVGQEGTVEQRYVSLGPQYETSFIVEDGLQEGESVIVEGLQRIRPGVPVKALQATRQEG